MANLEQRNDPIRPASPGRGQTALPAWIRWGMAVWLGWAGSVFGAPGVTAQLDRETVPLGESVTLSLVFEDVSPTEFPALPAIPSLTVTPQGTSRQHRFVNGQSSSSQTFTYNVAPSRVGDVLIPAMQLQAGGQVFTTRPLRLRVVKGGAAGAGADTALSSQAFLRLVVPKTEVYVGEPFPVEIHLYFKSIQDVQAPQLNAEGFSIGATAKPTQTATRVGNDNFNLAVFRMSATAAKAGSLTLGPAECGLSVRMPSNNPRRRDPFDSFFGFGTVQVQPTTLRSEPQVMNVLPWPTQNVPEGFNGAVGDFSLAVRAGPTNLSVGDPITVRIEVGGRGLLDALTLPAQPQWREFKVYPASSKVQSNDPLGLEGVKIFEQVVIPQNHEIRALPAFRFCFFDPNQKVYTVLSNAPIPLQVQTTVSATLPTLTNGAARAQAPAAADELAHIRARLEGASTTALPMIRQGWFLALQAVPVLGWLSLFLRRRRAEALANNPRRRRRLQVALRMKEGMGELRSLAAGRQAEAFFATLFRLLQEQLGERLDLPASAITESIIDERLRGGGLSTETLGALREMFQVCHKARYAPQQSSEELASLIPRAEVLIGELRTVSL